MKRTVKVSFLYSADGLKSDMLAVGSEVDFLPDSIVPGLEAAGLVHAVAAPVPAPVPAPVDPLLKPVFSPVVNIPADWKSMKWADMRALAEKIKGSSVHAQDEARSVIEAEVARRAHQ